MSNQAVFSGKYTDSGKPIYVSDTVKKREDAKIEAQEKYEKDNSYKPDSRLTKEAQEKYSGMQRKYNVIDKSEYEQIKQSERERTFNEPEQNKQNIKVVDQGFKEYYEAKRRIDSGVGSRDDINLIEKYALAKTGYVSPAMFSDDYFISPAKKMDSISRTFEGTQINRETNRQIQNIKEAPDKIDEKMNELSTEIRKDYSTADVANVLTGKLAITKEQSERYSPIQSEINKIQDGFDTTYLKSQKQKSEYLNKDINIFNEKNKELQRLEQTTKGMMSDDAAELREDIKERKTKLNYDLNVTEKKEPTISDYVPDQIKSIIPKSEILKNIGKAPVNLGYYAQKYKEAQINLSRSGFGQKYTAVSKVLRAPLTVVSKTLQSVDPIAEKFSKSEFRKKYYTPVAKVASTQIGMIGSGITSVGDNTNIPFVSNVVSGAGTIVTNYRTKLTENPISILSSAGNIIEGGTDYLNYNPLGVAVTAATAYVTGAITSTASAGLIATEAQLVGKAGLKAGVTQVAVKAGQASLKYAAPVVFGSLAANEAVQISKIEDRLTREKKTGELITMGLISVAGYKAGSNVVAPEYRGSTSLKDVIKKKALIERSGDLPFKVKYGKKTELKTFEVDTKGNLPKVKAVVGSQEVTTPVVKGIKFTTKPINIAFNKYSSTLTQNVNVGGKNFILRQTSGNKNILTIGTKGSKPFYSKNLQQTKPLFSQNLIKELKTNKEGFEYNDYYSQKTDIKYNKFNSIKDTDSFSTSIKTERSTFYSTKMEQPAFVSTFNDRAGLTVLKKTSFTKGSSNELVAPVRNINNGLYTIESPGVFKQTITVKESSVGTFRFNNNYNPSYVSFNSIKLRNIKTDNKGSTIINFLKNKKGQSKTIFQTFETQKKIVTPKSNSISKNNIPDFSVSSLKTSSQVLTPILLLNSNSNQLISQEFNVISGVSNIYTPSIKTESDIQNKLDIQPISKKDSNKDYRAVLIPDYKTDIVQLNKQVNNVASDSISKVDLTFLPIQDTNLISETDTPVTPDFGYNPVIPVIEEPPIPPPILPGFIPTLSEQDKKKKKKKTKKKQTRYAPSFEAVGLGIYGKKETKKLYSGFDIRPIVGKQKKGVSFKIKRGKL